MHRSRSSLILPLFLGLLSTACSRTAAADPAPPVLGQVSATEPRVGVPDSERGLSLDLSDRVREALSGRDFAAAASGLLAMDAKKIPGDRKSEWAFLTAWCLVQSGRAAEAQPYLALFEGSAAVPAAYAAVTAAAIHRAVGAPDAALKALESVGPDAPLATRAMLERAEIYRSRGRTADGWAIYEQIAARPDPSPGVAKALLALAERAGDGNPKAYPLLRRIWSAYPRTEESIAANKKLAAFPNQKPTFAEVTRRAERLMEKGEFAAVIEETDPYLSEATGSTPETCRFLLARGRSLYKMNKLSDSIVAFGNIGSRCSPLPEDFGARGLYLVGQAQGRKKEYKASADAYLELANRYPKSTLVDDALTQAGYALHEAGNPEGALRTWKQVLDQYPDGDTAPEAAFRYAFGSYLAGRPDDARDAAVRLGQLPLASDLTHVAAGRYWAARWAMYPDVANPTVDVTDPAQRKLAIDEWVRLCEELPHNFYAVLAWSRLREVDPEIAQRLAVRPADRDRGTPKPWIVRQSFYEDPAVREGVRLARLGLIREAMAAWDEIDRSTVTAEEMAWMTELRTAAGDWLLAHEAMRKWLNDHPPGTLGAQEAQVLRVAYPDRYWTEVKQHAAGYPYEPRLFHALVREESNFNKGIVSHAGAYGLSQLMPATAREVAKTMGTTVSTTQLENPSINLKIGARYLADVHGRKGGSPYLSLASYNAGEHRVSSWLTAWGNVPTDEFVERIPFRETRGYVRRVMGTWQAMRWQFDDSPSFYDLAAYNHRALLPR
jgi:soluble lytic murein transglycosylase